MSEPLTVLKYRLARVRDLEAAANVLEWDQETYMPDGAAEARAHQVSTLRQLAHEYLTTDELAALVDALDGRLEGDDAALVRVTRRLIDRKRRLPAALVVELAGAVSRAKQAWKSARERNDFPVFAPHLKQLVDINIRIAEAVGYAGHRYDALLEEYEPGATAAEIATVFAALRERLVPIVKHLADAPQVDAGVLTRAFDTQAQWEFGMMVLRDIGFDFNRGRQDLSAHPFTTTFAITDVRLTTRVNERFLPSALFGSLHEGGHGLYEQGIDLAFDRSPLADGTSLGMHESQSCLWENLIGRSRPFWEHYYPKLKAAFPGPLADISLDAFYRAINAVAPTPIRVEADEVTYNLHIMLRFELEMAMLDGSLSVDDLPGAWNDRMEAYLGIRPPNDADGVLQDIHWSLGAFGYFPTYALGNLMSAQLYDAIRIAIPDLDDQIRAGRFEGLLGWLRTHIHGHGKAVDAGDLLERVTGSRLTSDNWIAYIEKKYVKR
ncbi:MAG: carboxypeptidase M32 [Rhodothermales bacterium]|nr:carboxypeptidase M32 [Rhodothermales bacterium]